MRFCFHPEAEAELDAAVGYYEERRPGLGIELAEEVYATIARIIEHPEAWSISSPSTRRALVSRFPYGLTYQIHSGTLRIIAVANLRRRPGYWKERIE